MVTSHLSSLTAKKFKLSVKENTRQRFIQSSYVLKITFVHYVAVDVIAVAGTPDVSRRLLSF